MPGIQKAIPRAARALANSLYLLMGGVAKAAIYCARPTEVGSFGLSGLLVYLVCLVSRTGGGLFGLSCLSRLSG